MLTVPDFYLTPELLQWELSQHGFSCKTAAKSFLLSPCLQRCRLYTHTTICEPHTLYLIGSLEVWMSLPASAFTDNMFLLVLAEDQILPLNFPCMLLTTALPLTVIYEKILDIFDAYRHWDDELKKELLNGRSIPDFCETVFRFLQIPLTVTDAHFRILARPHHVEGVHSALYHDTETGGYYYPQSLRTEMHTDPSFQNTLTTSKAQWWTVSDTEIALYCNLRDSQGNFEGRLVFRSSKIKLQNFHMQIMDYLAQYLEILFETIHNDNQMPDKHSIGAWMTSFLFNKTQPDNTHYVLQTKGWKSNDQYLCLCLCKFTTHIQSPPEPLEYLFIHTLFPDSGSCIYQNHYVVLLNMSRMQMRIRDIELQMSPYIREGLLKMGISDPFYDFSQFRAYYAQAQFALNWILQPSQSLWSFPFYKCALQAMLDQLEMTSSSFYLISGKLDQLETVDKTHHSTLYETLRVYLANERNIKYTAAHFQVHRTTIYYRLEQITELLHLNLDDYETRLYLLLSFALKDRLSANSVHPT